MVVETNVAVEINVDTSMPDKHPSKCSRIQSKEIDRDPGSRKQICEFLSTNKMKSGEFISKKVYINLNI